jgi:MEMO1 family protein
MASTAVRAPAVAGHFYPRDPAKLRSEVQAYLSPSEKPVAALGCVIPHAGYMYSGHVAGAVYSQLDLPSRFIILCPNHTGRGTPLAIMSAGEWQTPLGRVAIDAEIASLLKSHFPLLNEDSEAHRTEHATEVQLPFLQARLGQFTFVPIAVGTGRFELLSRLGDVIGETVVSLRQRVMIIASSDMNHYESDAITRQKDARAIDRILALDPQGLYDVVTSENITMCGYGPTVAMLTAAKHLGATKAELIRYATSGDVSGDREMVVGYAGVAVV